MAGIIIMNGISQHHVRDSAAEIGLNGRYGVVLRLELEKTKAVFEVGIGTGRLAARTVPLFGCFFGIDISAFFDVYLSANLYHFYLSV